MIVLQKEIISSVIFFNHPIVYDGILYQNNEAAFQAQKTTDRNIRKSFSSLNPSEAKRKGRRVSLRQDWELIKDQIMYSICKEKFLDPNLAEKLKQTYAYELIEGNTWHDNYWGDCKCPKCKNIVGRNMLGKILMRIREENLI